MRLILIRHGETVENARRVVQGHLPGRLSLKGETEASSIARWLRGETVMALYSSDLKRAMDTAAILLKGAALPEIKIDKRLREQSFGIYEGKSAKEFLRDLKESKSDLRNFDPPEGERARDFQARVGAFLDELLSEDTDETIALVTHNGFIRATLEYLSNANGSGNPLKQKKNSQITVLNLDLKGNVEIEDVDCTQGA